MFNIIYALKTFIAFILVFFAIVFFHEFGHFAFAKLFKVRVREFFLGFGPSIFEKKFGETIYSFKAFPLGGAVVMEGEDEDSEDPNSFSKKPLYQRFLIVLAGPMMNFVIAIIIFMIVSFNTGVAGTRITKIVKETPAAVSDIKIGDQIESVNGKEVKNWNDIVENISKSKNLVELKVKRDNQDKNIILKPIKEDNRSIIGISTLDKSANVVVKKSVADTYNISKEIVMFIPKLFYDKKAQSEVGGPVAIYKMVGQVSEYGFMSLLMFTGLLSINLGVMNLLPIPALDGGRLAIYLIEIITRKKVNENIENNLHRFGFVLLMGLMVFVFFKDIISLF